MIEMPKALAEVLRDKGLVLLVEPYVCPTTAWYRSGTRRRCISLFKRGQLRQETLNLHVLTPFVWLPPRLHRYSWVKRLNYWTIARQIRTALHSIASRGWHQVNWVCHPHQVDYVNLAGEGPVVYDCYDQYEANPCWSEGEKERIRREEATLLHKADIVFVVSKRLQEIKQKTHSNVHVVPNGADTAFFSRVRDPQTSVAEMMTGLRPPIIGYLGTLNYQIDIGLLAHVAEARPEWTLVIVGGDDHTRFLSESDVYSSLRYLPNVKFAGWVREEVPAYFKAIDACLLPYRTDLTFSQFSDPLKLYDYLAMGKPVVSTDIPSARAHADMIKIAHTEEEFVACIEQALAEDGPERITERLLWAQDNSWKKRAEHMMEIVYEAMPD